MVVMMVVMWLTAGFSQKHLLKQNLNVNLEQFNFV